MKKVHFIGIGGIGMSALADILITRGITVTGSDLRPNNLTGMLGSRGAVITAGHSKDNVPADADLVVKSTCIRDDNPEVLRAMEAGLELISRGEMLRIVMEGSPLSVAVTGTHGKTTSSGIISYIADHCGMDPTVLVGGEMTRFGKNVRSGGGEIVVAEVDESDGYFRNMGSTHALITNVEREHMEHYGSMEALLDAYREFIEKISPSGVLVFNGDDPILSDLVGSSRAKKISFGLDQGNAVTCDVLEYKKRIEFGLIRGGEVLVKIRSDLVGMHNVRNILGAAALSLELGLDGVDIADAVAQFDGVRRRFDRVGTAAGVDIIEDYAHHPTELRSVISAARDYSRGRVITIFQPHRYSRTRDLMKDFASCFKGSDIFILTDIYSADEDPSGKMDVKVLFDAVDRDVFSESYLAGKEDIAGLVAGIVKTNDTVLVLGAGDIRDISRDLLGEIGQRAFMPQGK
jgi:UDP-N-acetylmuramate--alanine ligase